MGLARNVTDVLGSRHLEESQLERLETPHRGSLHHELEQIERSVIIDK